VILAHGDRGRRAPPPLRRLAFAIALAALPAVLAGPSDAAMLRGRVVDRSGKPIEYANVSVPAMRRGAVTDAEGRFELDLPAGPVVLEVTQMGYERARMTVTLAESGAETRVILADEPVPIGEVVVATSSFGKLGKGEGATLRRMDILTTPGGAADLMMALRTMPGFNAPVEGAALFVRGGHPNETLVRLDGGEIGHPYHYEGASGGLFSAFDTYLIKSAFFSSGGFSAKYGGVLSGVLDVETIEPRNLRTVSVGANLAGGSASTTWALIPDRLSLTATGRVSDIRLLDRLYPPPREYVATPNGNDGAGKLQYRYSPTGKLSLLYLGVRDEVGVTASTLNFEGVYRQRSSNHFGALQFEDAVGSKLALRGQVSAQRYTTAWSFGSADADLRERQLQGNLDAVWDASSRQQLSFGINARHLASERFGRLPADSTDLGEGAPVRFVDTRPTLDYPGFYLEDKVRLWGGLYGTIGGRFDYASRPGVWTADPRLTLAWRLDEHQTVRVATGRYHQLADAEYLDRRYGNPDLGPMRSDHVIAGYEWLTDVWNVRLEAFRKDYRDLVTQSAETYYANQGHGYARGVDAFVRGRAGWLTGWVSYGYLDTRRRELDDPREVPAAHGVRHSLTLVGLYELSSQWQMGSRLSLSSGRPFTPIVGATYDPGRDLWRPIEGEHHSEELPEYGRLDLRLIRLFSMPAGVGLPASSVCVAYVEALNVLDRSNTLEYAYNQDYSQRRATESYFGRRIVVAGFALSW
jgi:hypothetical protein